MNLNTSLFHRIVMVIGITFTLHLALQAASPSPPRISDSLLADYIQSRYESLESITNSKPPFDVYHRGYIGYLNILEEGYQVSNHLLTLIDFRLSANEQRMWVIDLTNNRVLYQRLVAHGKKSGGEYASSFSNSSRSNQISLGIYMTAENYYGKHGLSLRLDGLEEGFNDQARERAVVLHAAAYVSQDFVKSSGRIGRSHGCPTIGMKGHRGIIRRLSNQSVLYIYYPLDEYLANTRYFDLEKASAYYHRQYL